MRIGCIIQNQSIIAMVELNKLLGNDTSAFKKEA